MTQASALYRGAVAHRRFRPKAHRLRYRVFWLLLDLAELDGLGRRLTLFSRNRFNLLSFHDRDHGDGSQTPLRVQIEARLQAVGVDLQGGAIRLLTMPRMLGFVFNPISLYYCHRPDGTLAGMVYEVTSTFGLRHFYVAPIQPKDQAVGVIRQEADKALYVSPFMGMNMRYAFRGRAPDAGLGLTIEGRDAEGVLITATLAGRRRDLSDRQLLAAAVQFPLLTLKVVAAIHWEALKLWLKGVPLTRQPAASLQTLKVRKT
ncbi:DUF1365 domain-containing protein [Caulobacter sp. RHG1]|uniref:DUF1365 domain-containing protein n=1 Tax=Caulobacter sp. (strain RHG1) TaxID=2545762 RepID=UPI0015535BDE|nr:DUF1365 family protein [Caulobacter sp. RHG1]NQE60896.1 hypothetical protein [Caulobacter sp. RHG1]